MPDTPAFNVNISWGLRILPAAILLTGGAAKIAGEPMLVRIFAQPGFGQWFRYVTAGVEIAGEIALFVLSGTLAWLMRYQLLMLRERLL